MFRILYAATIKNTNQFFSDIIVTSSQKSTLPAVVVVTAFQLCMILNIRSHVKRRHTRGTKASITHEHT